MANDSDNQVEQRQVNDDPRDAVSADGYTLEQCVADIIARAELEAFVQWGGRVQ